MVKKFLLPFLGTLFLVFFITACAPVYCSTPYILSNGACCIDNDEDGKCDLKNVTTKIAHNYTLPKVPPLPPPPSVLPTTKEGALLTVTPDEGPYLGNVEAATLFVQYGDYTDRNTQRFHNEILPTLLDKYGAHMKYAFRHYPSLSNRYSQQAAEAAECAKDQEAFWDYHAVLVNNTHSLSKSYLSDYAEQANLDRQAFDSCLSQRYHIDAVLATRKEATSYGVILTPTFFVNNQRIAGLKTLAVFETALEDALYEELKLERGTNISAKSLGKAHLILEGPSVLNPTITTSPYTNILDLSDATFAFQAQDLTKEDSPMSKDQAQLSVAFTLSNSQRLQKDTYQVVLQNLITEGISHTFYGGIGTSVLINGNTGIGTAQLPSSVAHAVVWGLADVYKNNRLIADNTFTQFVITQGIRDKDHKLRTRADSSEIEAYFLIAGKYGGKHIQELEQGYLYLFWDTLDLRQ